jgi:hypothetical protein
LHYTVKIPANYPTGLYWYHTHAHGEAERQTLSGMSGALVIDGIAAYAPQVSQMIERILIARDAPLPAALLAAIDPSPPTATAAAPAAAAKAAALVARVSPQAQRFRFPSSVRRMRSATIAQTRTIYYSDQNTINGAAYDPAAPPMFYAQSGRSKSGPFKITRRKSTPSTSIKSTSWSKRSTARRSRSSS